MKTQQHCWVFRSTKSVRTDDNSVFCCDRTVNGSENSGVFFAQDLLLAHLIFINSKNWRICFVITALFYAERSGFYFCRFFNKPPQFPSPGGVPEGRGGEGMVEGWHRDLRLS
jgi:hypothetical protein